MNDAFLRQLLEFLMLQKKKTEEEQGWLNPNASQFGGKPVPRAPSFPMPPGMMPPQQPWQSPIGTPQQAQQYFRQNGF